MKDAEILCDQLFIVKDVAGRAGEHATSGVEDHRVIGNIERQLLVPFDQQAGCRPF
jgi:hypothetical protein